MFSSCMGGCGKGGADEDEGGGHDRMPRIKEDVKSLGSQMKDMALKLTGGNKESKSEEGSSSNSKNEERPYPDFETISEGDPLPSIESSSSFSTPAFDITRSTVPGAASGERFGFSYDRVPRLPQSVTTADIAVNSDETREWLAQVEPGVSISFLALPNGGNDLRRIRFNREMFDKWQAQRWWGENYDRILELYNVRTFHDQVFNTPPRIEDEP